MEKARDLFLVSLIASTIFFVNLGAAKLWDRDEPRNAGCAREMMDRGDWITPVFNDELRDAKPVLLYWFIMSAYQLFGVNEFAARFWSAALAVGTVALTWWMAQRMFGRRTGFLSAIILATSLMFGVAARAATPDSLLIFFSTAALAIFVHFAFPADLSRSQSPGLASERRNHFPRSPIMAITMYGVMGLGVLAKGPIGLLMPTAIIGMYLLIVTRADAVDPEGQNAGRRQGLRGWLANCCRFWEQVVHPVHFLRTCWSMRLVTATLMVLGIAGPWYYLVGQATDGEFLRTFFLKEHLGRSTTSFENHSGSIFYYPVVMAVGFFPWSVLALPVVLTLSRQKVKSRQLVFLVCWVGVQVGLFTLVQTKLPSYVTPCYPALAILCGYCLHGWSTGEVPIAAWLPRVAFATLGLAGVVAMIGLVYAATTVLNVSGAIGLIGLIPLAVALFSLALWHQATGAKAKQAVVRCLATGAGLFSVLFFGFLLPHVSARQQYDQLLAPMTRSANPVANRSNQPLGSFGCLEPSWVFYGGQPIFELVEHGDETQSLEPRSADWQPKARPDLKWFLVEQRGRVIAPEKLLPQVHRRVGRPVSIVSRSPYFMKSEDLVLIEVGDSEAVPALPARLTQRPAESPRR